ncbi:phage DNA ejection protein [Citrobacter portucalensis]|uniref:phage DNA ejection protein n=1 Tax=Citrobacter portucalensis TaxID=1639133 RepID=UPI002B3E957B|nr:phage DNA ejection protein [Citrobacter portucalensis]MEB2740704.1 phage DNA ejection protein [Citrobacter portucalensis]
MAQFGGLQGLGAPINYYDTMIPDFRREALQETQNRVGQQQVIASQMQNQQAQRDNQRRQDFYTAIESATPDQLPALRRQFPEFAQNIQQEIGIQSAEHASFVHGALNDLSVAAASGNPQAVQSAIQKNGPALSSLGVSQEQASQLYQQDPQRFNSLLNATRLATLPMDKQFETQQNQQRIDETVRSNKAGEGLQARGQNLNYQSAMTGHNLAAQRLALDQQEFGLKVQQAQQKAQELIEGAPKLSVNMEKGIETAVNNATASSNSADSMSALAQQFRQEKPTTGLFGSANNMFSKLTGSETALRDLRIRQNAIINSQVLKYLPPGPATDRDVNLAREGAPSSWDDPEIVANWLDANARLERRNAQFNEFKSEWMSANGNPGQSRNGGQILGMDVQKGESLGSAVKRYMANNPVDNATAAKPTGAHTSKSGIQFTVE